MESHDLEQNEIRLVDLLRTVFRRKWYILGATVLMAVVGFGVTFFLPKTYEATATVFPVSSGSKSGSLSQFSGLASLAGISLPESDGSDSAKSVGALMSSRILVEALLRSPTLSARFKIPQEDFTKPDFTDRYIGTIGAIKSSLSYKTDPKTGVLSITASWRDPEIALEICDSTLNVLDELLVTKAMTSNRKRGESLAKQIVAQKAKLDQIQAQLAKFQTETTLLDPKSQSTQSIDTYTGMIRQKMELELKLSSALDSYSSDNPRITSLKNQIANLEKQTQQFKNQDQGDLPSIKAAPQNIIKYQNLYRELEIATQIYTGLLASNEQAKLSDDKEQVYIEVMDKALLPKIGKPSVSTVVMAFTALGFFASFVLALLFDPMMKFIQSMKKNDDPSVV